MKRYEMKLVCVATPIDTSESESINVYWDPKHWNFRNENELLFEQDKALKSDESSEYIRKFLEDKFSSDSNNWKLKFQSVKEWNIEF